MATTEPLNDPTATTVDARELAELLVALTRDSECGAAGPMRRMHRLAQACIDFLGVAGAGVLLRTSDQAVSAEAARPGPVQELLELDMHHGGPGREACWSGAVVEAMDLASAAVRWPTFAPAACAAGLRSVLVLPLCDEQGEPLGSLTMLGRDAGAAPTGQRWLAQALADATTVGLLNARSAARRDARIAQLQTALDSRVVLEQAKGMLAQHHGVDMEAAWLLLRRRARDGNQRVHDVAGDLVSGRLVPLALARPRPVSPRRSSRRTA